MSAAIKPMKECPYYKGMGFYTSDSNFDPAVEWPGTTWQKLEGVFILAASSGHPVGESGGEETHTLIDAELPVIDGQFATAVTPNHATTGVSGHAYGSNMDSITPSGSKRSWTASTTAAQYGYGFKFGGSQPHNNMPPYITRAYWERIA